MLKHIKILFYGILWRYEDSNFIYSINVFLLIPIDSWKQIANLNQLTEIERRQDSIQSAEPITAYKI